MKRLNSFLVWSHGVVSHAFDIKCGSNVFCNASYNACNGSTTPTVVGSYAYPAIVQLKPKIIQYILSNKVLMVILMLFMGVFRV